MMKQSGRLLLVLGLFLILFASCRRISDPVFIESLRYKLLIKQGWNAFEAMNYPLAVDKFGKAKYIFPDSVEAHKGIGWSALQMDSLSLAASAFDSGSAAYFPDADLFAGWAFLLNVVKQYEASNQKIDLTLARDSLWVFTHRTSIDVADLYILKAENYFLIGEFENSLQTVQTLNPVFSTDVATSAGRAALAAEIERLKGEYS